VASAVDSPALRAELRRLTEAPDERVGARARAVLDGLHGAPWDPERATRQRADARALSMLVTAQSRQSPKLIRRVLALERRELGPVGRKVVAVAFERALNWALLPDDELLEIARRIDGPEMEPIWRYALGRSDAIGDRARAIAARLRGS
jgi:hypothetical protein